MMTDTEQTLPQGWVECTLGDIGDWGSGGTPSRSHASFFQGNIPWIKTGELGEKYVRCAEEKITVEAVKKSSAKIFPKGSVGIAMYGATIGKVSIWGIDASTNQACAVVNAYDGVFNEYVYYYLLSEKRSFINAGKGGAQPNISQTILKPWYFPLPPLNEQKRIVAKIEALFSEIDKGVEELKTAQAKAKQYRQALLKHAFSGKLTADWRAEHGASGEWKNIKIVDVYEVFVGATPSRKVDEYWKGDIPWVSSGEVQFCRIKGTKEKITQLGLAKSSTKLHPKGTVMLGMIGEGKTRGQAAILDIKAAHNQNTAAIRVNPLTDVSEYLYYYLQYQYEITRKIGSGNNQKALNKTRVAEIKLPHCPLSEQEEIVRRLEAQFSVLDVLEADLATNLKKAETLKQAILKKAFAGKLVPQDPTDEPASELLKRIQAEKATQAKTPRKKKATTSQ